MDHQESIINHHPSTALNPEPRLPWRNFIKLILIGCAMTTITNFPSAFTHTSVNTAVKELKGYLNESFDERGWELNREQQSVVHGFVNSCWFAGQVIGSFFSPLITDKYGRKPAYLLSTAMMTLACALQAISTMFPYPEFLVIGRILASMFSPMSDAAFVLYMQEISPTGMRGTMSAFFASGYAVMALLGAVLGMESVLGHSLPLLFSVPIAPGILSLVFLAMVPETPKFLQLAGAKKAHKLRKALEFYQGPAMDTSFYKPLADNGHSKQEGMMTDRSFWDLWRRRELRRAIFLTFAVFALALPFYPILQSSTHFMKEVGISAEMAEFSSTGLMIMFVVASAVGTLLMSHVSRRGLILWSGFFSIISMLVFVIGARYSQGAVVVKYIAMLGFYAYTLCYGLGFGTVSYFIGTEFCDIEYRSTVFSVCYSLNNIFIVLTNMQAIWAFKKFGPVAFLPLFGVPCLTALVYLYFRLPETRNRDIEDIVEELRSNRCGLRSAALLNADKVAPVFSAVEELDVTAIQAQDSPQKLNKSEENLET
ncbi:unnamed protein product [Bursaphelenchus okinawaensis]|uniref:Major facilitator superfamily (MFS) profile domain-containing protein n=1 Tax=Bursaphelenchus okinawaensis TaxID=465554 RepID=A0A811KR91_9BILA|nr:unnamed protein product [Bursaphelenchus okinawaensis]CAG9109614.1 unnamed protein product [Bursaphelenchus okinawaensis]